MNNNLDNPMISGRVLVKNIFYNGIGRIIPLLVAIFSIPLLIEALGVEKFGVLTLIWMVVGYFSFFDFGIGRALTKLVSEKIGKNEKEEIPTLIWTGIILLLLFGIAGGLIFAALIPLIINLMNIPVTIQQDVLNCFYLLAFSIPVVILSNGFRGVLEGYQKFGIVNSIGTPLGIFSYLAPLIMSYYSPNLVPIVELLILGRFIVLLFFGKYCYSLIPELKTGKFFDKGKFAALFHFGGWLTITNILGPIMVYIDRFLIGILLPISILAYYTTPYEVVTKLWIIPGTVIGVLFPAFSHSFSSDLNKLENLFLKALKFTFFVIFPITIGIELFAPEILGVWLNKEFVDKSSLVLRILMIGVFINCIAQIYYTLLQSIGKPDLTAKIHLAEVIIYLPTFYFLIKAYGIEGAAIAWTMRLILDGVLLYAFTNKFLFHASRQLLKFKNIFISLVFVSIITTAPLINDLIIKVLFFVIVVSIQLIFFWKHRLFRDERLFIKSNFNFY